MTNSKKSYWTAFIIPFCYNKNRCTGHIFRICPPKVLNLSDYVI